MRSVSLSKYLSKSVHFLTTFVYLFTFLGPSIALATQTPRYESSDTETYTVPSSSSHAASSSQDISDKSDTLETPDQNEQHINIAQGWGAQSLFFGIGHIVQHLVSPLTLSSGDLPYKEVIEEGISLGFRGELDTFGQFICCWDGSLLFEGYKKSPAQADLAKKETEKKFSSTREVLVLDTFAPVTLSNFIAKAVKVTAQRIFFGENIEIEEATLTPTAATDLEAFSQVSIGSSVSITNLMLSRGTLTNLGSFTGHQAKIGRNASFVNGGTAHITTLRGQGLFLNHNLFEGLTDLSIRRFINRNNAFLRLGQKRVLTLFPLRVLRLNF